MPITLVNESILNSYHQIVVCPYREERVFEYEDIDKLIYEKANSPLLERNFKALYDYKLGTIYVTKGFDLATHIFHVISPDWITDPNFEIDMFKTYNNLCKLIKIKQYKDVVIPVIKFSFKRLGNKNSYRTAKTLLQYLVRKYDLNHVNFYLLVDKQSVYDDLNDYVSTYVSTSWPLSKRHKPRPYKLNNFKDLKKLRKKYKIVISKKKLPVNRYYDKQRQFFSTRIYNEIYKQYRVVRDRFCFFANLSYDRYQQLFKDGTFPTKEELYGMCVSLKLSYEEMVEVFEESPYEIDYRSVQEQIIISYIALRIYDIHAINELLYLYDVPQIGSIYEMQPTEANLCF